MRKIYQYSIFTIILFTLSMKTHAQFGGETLNFELRLVNKGTLNIWEGPDLPWIGVEIKAVSPTPLHSWGAGAFSSTLPKKDWAVYNLNLHICIPTSVYNTGVDIQGWMTPAPGSGWYFTSGNNMPPSDLFTNQSSGGFRYDLSTYALTENNVSYTIRAIAMNSPLFFSRDMVLNEWVEMTSFVLTDENKTIDNITICDYDFTFLNATPPIVHPNITFGLGVRNSALYSSGFAEVNDIFYKNGRWTYGSGTDYAPDNTDGSKNMTLDTDVTLPSGGVAINNLTLEAGAKLSIEPGDSLKVNGAVTNDVGTSGFIVEADSTGYGQYMGPAIEGTFEQHIGAGSSAGWRFLSLPITGGVITDISDDTPVQGVPGGSGTDADPNFFIYDNTGAFEQPANVTTAWGDGYGFGLYFFNNTFHGSSTLPLTLDASGSEPSSDVTVALNPAASGYTLVGNPFASNYNTNSLAAGSSNISNNIAFWDDETSSYSIQDRTTPYIIAPWQGFWVQTLNAAATTLTIPASGKTSSDTTGTFFSKTANNRGDIHFTVSSATTYDEAIRLAFREGATFGYDADDFGKLTPLLASYATMAFASNGTLKSVESLPYDLDQEVTVELQPQLVGVSGEFAVAWNGLETIPAEWELTLHDYDMETSVNMRDASEYVFTAGAQAKANSNPLSLLTGPAAVAMKAKTESNRFGITIRPASVSNEPDEKPLSFGLEQNYPNPFNPSTTISYTLETAGNVNISVYTLMGQKVATLVNEAKTAGTHSVRWNATGAASGMYYYRLEANGQSITRKMMLIK